MNCLLFVHRCIKPEATGLMLKNRTKREGYTVKAIQKKLGLSCPQPIYRWFKGFALPSLDNLYSLSRIFKVHLEELVISTYFDRCDFDRINIKRQNKRIMTFLEFQK